VLRRRGSPGSVVTELWAGRSGYLIMHRTSFHGLVLS
jgi:hypothetical protein